MNNIEIPKRINQIIAIFYRCGLWRNEDETVARKMTRQLLCLVLYLCFSVSLALGAYITDSDDECIFLAVVAITSVVTAVRMSYILWRKNDILKLIQEIGVHSIKDHDVFIQIDNKSKSFIKFAFYFVIMIFITAVVMTVSSLPGVASVKRLPLNIAFILDWKNSVVGYWMAFVFVVCASMLTFVCMLFIVLIWYLMLNCSMKYEVLGCQFRKVGVCTNMKPPVKKGEVSKEENQNSFLEELIKLIKVHRNIKETTERFRSCFANLFIVQIATSAMGICGSIYALVFTVDASLFQYELYVAVLVYNLLDILVVMYLGNEIKLSSSRLSYCLFESNWIEQSQPSKKCIIILMEVLKQPHELVIGKLYPMNLEQFNSILNLAYSMFNILQNIK